MANWKVTCTQKTKKLISNRKMILMSQLVKENLTGEKWKKIKIIISLRTKYK